MYALQPTARRAQNCFYAKRTRGRPTKRSIFTQATNSKTLQTHGTHAPLVATDKAAYFASKARRRHEAVRYSGDQRFENLMPAACGTLVEKKHNKASLHPRGRVHRTLSIYCLSKCANCKERTSVWQTKRRVWSASSTITCAFK